MKNHIVLLAIVASLTGCTNPYDSNFGPASRPKSELGQIAAAYQYCRSGAEARENSGIPDPALCSVYRQLLASIPESEMPDVGNKAENQLIAEARRQALR